MNKMIEERKKWNTCNENRGFGYNHGECEDDLFEVVKIMSTPEVKLGIGGHFNETLNWPESEVWFGTPDVGQFIKGHFILQQCLPLGCTHTEPFIFN